jgi:hypothetical protein
MPNPGLQGKRDFLFQGDWMRQQAVASDDLARWI